MTHLTRRTWLAAGATVLAGVAARKPARAQEMQKLSDIVVAKPPRVLPAVKFLTLDGAAKTLADYAGTPVVLNFWATWCTPCVAELPELDKLAAAGGFAVLAVSVDRGGAATVRPFAASHGITHLTLLTDPGLAASHALDVAGFPTTLLIGADGRLRGTLEGPAAWGGAGAVLKALLKG
jgi:thiol-disulfide isomerase/thioredoxin